MLEHEEKTAGRAELECQCKLLFDISLYSGLVCNPALKIIESLVCGPGGSGAFRKLTGSLEEGILAQQPALQRALPRKPMFR